MRKSVNNEVEVLIYNLENIGSPLKKCRFATLFALLIIIFGITPYTEAVNLPETGQTACYVA